MESEVDHFDSFDNVYLVSLKVCDADMSKMRYTPSSWHIVPVRFAPKIVYLLNSFDVLFDRNLYRDLRELLKQRKLSFSTLKELFVFLSRARYEARKACKALELPDDSQYIFYSYRFDYQPYLACLIKKWKYGSATVVSRAHGYDLYEERRSRGYIPLRSYLLSELTAVFPCSANGENYLRTRYPDSKCRISKSYLGTSDYGCSRHEKAESFRLISCSDVLPVKRLGLLVSALRRIDCYRIEWTHFGDGKDLEKLKKEAQDLPDNIKTVFRGRMSHSALMEHYQSHHYDLFVNVSSSEGIPVSIMEAMSFGIPCLATDAGGTSELVKDGCTGRILPVEVTPDAIADAIVKFIDMEDAVYDEMRKASRQEWLERYNADVNFEAFSQELLQLCDSHECYSHDAD